MPIRFDFMARAYEEKTSVMSSYAKAAYMTGNIVIDGQPVATNWIGVSSGLFSMLGITPARGRGFLPGEDVAGADQVVVVSDQFWQRNLGGKDDVLERKIIVGDSVCTVIGVLRSGQMLPPYFYADVFRPLVYRVDPAQPWMPQLFLLGRLRPGVTREQAAKILAETPVEVPAPLRQFTTEDRAALSSMKEVSRLFRPEIYWVMLGPGGLVLTLAGTTGPAGSANGSGGTASSASGWRWAAAGGGPSGCWRWRAWSSPFSRRLPGRWWRTGSSRC